MQPCLQILLLLLAKKRPGCPSSFRPPLSPRLALLLNFCLPCRLIECPLIRPFWGLRWAD